MVEIFQGMRHELCRTEGVKISGIASAIWLPAESFRRFMLEPTGAQLAEMFRRPDALRSA
jgi:hypothetical protein